MNSFQELATSRRNWIEEVLIPWCRSANSASLLQAELDWVNLAGGVDPKATLWVWAWSRYPVLAHDGLPGLNETNEVRVTTLSGEIVVGYPDNSATHGSRLVLLTRLANGNFAHYEPISIDNIRSVELADPSSAVSHIPLPDRPLTMMPQFADDQTRI